MIPRVVYQTYASASSLPPAVVANIEHLKSLNPGWDHVLFDDAGIEDFIRKEYKPQYLQAYRQINPAYGAARADFFRYLLMYRRGGVYLDIKSTTTQPLDQTLHRDDRYILGHWPNRKDARFIDWGLKPELPKHPRGEFQNWHIICEPLHPFLHNTIELVMYNIRNYERDVIGIGRQGVLRTTGPIAYTQAITPLLHSHPHRLAGTHLDLGLQYNLDDAKGNVLSHLKFFKVHYTYLKEPVVLPNQ